MRSIMLVIPLAAALAGCEAEPPAAATADVVYVDPATDELFVGPPRPAPVANPKTGRPTLVRGLYSAEKRRWFAQLPAEGNPVAATAKAVGTPLATEGPIPPGTPRLPDDEAEAATE